MNNLEQMIMEARQSIIKNLNANRFEFPIKIKIIENDKCLAQYVHGSILDGEIKIQISSSFEKEILKNGIKGQTLSELERTIAHEVIHGFQNLMFHRLNLPLDYDEDEAEMLGRLLAEGLNIESEPLIQKIIPLLEDDSK